MGSLIYKYPARVGSEYPFTVTLPPLSFVTRIRVASVNAQVTVPAGTFSCYQYDTLIPYGREVSRRDFVAPGIGLVRREQLGPNSTGGLSVYSRVDLESYSLGTP